MLHLDAPVYLTSVYLGILGDVMNIVRVIGLIFLIISPGVSAGLITLDMKNFEYWDDYGEIQVGGRLSLELDTSKMDSHPDSETGIYDDAILGGSFFNAYSGKEYLLDITQSNSVMVDLSESFYTGLSLKGSFIDIDGFSASFDLWLEGTFKTDDRLDNLVEDMELFENETKFTMFADMDYFDGSFPEFVKIDKKVSVPEPHSAILLLIGMIGLSVLRFRPQ